MLLPTLGFLLLLTFPSETAAAERCSSAAYMAQHRSYCISECTQMAVDDFNRTDVASIMVCSFLNIALGLLFFAGLIQYMSPATAPARAASDTPAAGAATATASTSTSASASSSLGSSASALGPSAAAAKQLQQQGPFNLDLTNLKVPIVDLKTLDPSRFFAGLGVLGFFVLLFMFLPIGVHAAAWGTFFDDVCLCFGESSTCLDSVARDTWKENAHAFDQNHNPLACVGAGMIALVPASALALLKRRDVHSKQGPFVVTGDAERGGVSKTDGQETA